MFGTLILQNYNESRGPKSPPSLKDVFYDANYHKARPSIRHNGKWFFINGTTFELMITKFINMTSDTFERQYVLYHSQKRSTKTPVNKKFFYQCHMARYATDVTFQPICEPYGNVRKVYSSANQKLHIFKTDLSVNPTGMASGCPSYYPAGFSGL